MKESKNGPETPGGNGHNEAPLDRRQSTARILAELEQYCRAPLQRELAKWLDCAPNPDSLQAYANKFPDRWSQGVASLVRGAGYSEKVQVSSNLAILIAQLSDVEVMQQLAEVNEKLRALQAKQVLVPEEPGERKAIEAETGKGNAEEQREGERDENRGAL